MRLDFKALWVDDQPDGIMSYIERLDRGIRKEGFRFDPTVVQSVANAKAALADGVFKDNIDLVLVDYTLGGGPHGNVALREIRQQLPYRELIFYSADAAMNLRQRAHEEGVQGVYCAHREELVDTALGVFETLIKKALDIDHSRGIVMGATSDIDYLVHDVLLALHQKLDRKTQAEIRADIDGRIDKKLADVSKTVGAAKDLKTLDELFELRDLITAYDKLRILNGALEKAGVKQKDIRDKVTAYMQKIVPDRNLLGHVSVSINEAGEKVLRSRAGKELTEARLKELRVELLDHRENFHAVAGMFDVKR
jgi:CheY-like chemotaxis protein